MKRNKWDIFPKILIILLVLLAAYALYDHKQNVYRDLDFREVLSDFDDLIAAGRNTEALDALRSISKLELSSFQYLQILKRAYAFAFEAGAESLFSDLARNAAERFPGREELWFIYCRALIMNGNPEKAGELAQKNLRSGKFLGMRAESFLAANMEMDRYLDEEAAKSSFRTGGLIRLLNSRDPKQFVSVGKEWNSTELIADAALLYAEGGSVTEANELMKNSSENKFPELSLQLAYDAGDPQYGLVLIQQMRNSSDVSEPILQLYQADFSFALGRGKKTLEVYQDLMQENPDYSVLPYVNAAVLDSAFAEDYLRRGITYHPESTILLERLGELYYQTGETGTAGETFNKLLEIDPENPAVKIRLADLKLGAGSMGSTARLWSAYHGENGENLALFLGWRLFGNRDEEGLRVLTELQYQRSGRDQKVLEGLLLSLKRDYRNAAENFEAAYKINRYWEYLYNAGRLYLAAGDAENALDVFKQADEIFTMQEDFSSENRSRLWLGIGESHLAMGDIRNSSNALAYALDLDPDNLRASLLINTLNQTDMH
ncbi:tetratricopeptide repeat protein [Marispirochaeta sp.]|uniref:tetratricopeptide repeat protein n=1 Tax=Marispirochaeta sp. TaxID=2038653 RepID=UPI0029C8419B|nr:tetratricopeptide repeat protein [Marispirochaeta sp.]